MSAEVNKNDPKSRMWRRAWRRYLTWVTLDGDTEGLKKAHYLGWRAGVMSVRREQRAPMCPPSYARPTRQAWEHGAVTGRRSALDYLDESGKSPKAIR